MPLGRFLNETDVSCTPPLLDVSTFSTTGGYQPGRYCGLGSFEDGTTCCFPCPIQDWVYPPEWKEQLRIPNYLSILSVILCVFLLLSFAVLPPEKTHRHYLSVGLLVPVLMISLSFSIPVGVDPPLCYDAITPNDMKSDSSCAATGILVALGGLGSVFWVFLRSLWLHIRIFWDRDPGKKFKWGSIISGTIVPIIFLIALVTATGFSYRMGQTCLPNHENAIVTFWVWLVVFAVAAFILQAVTTGYCFFVYARTLRRERRSSPRNSLQRGRQKKQIDTWSNVKKLFFLQWRNILVSIFTIIGSISFFIVFWTQDSKLGHVFNDPNNLKPVKTWLICQALSRGDKKECRNYVSGFTVTRESVLASLILASLVGIEIFILLFRTTMFGAWRDLFRNLFHRAHIGRPPTPELTSLENPDHYLPNSSEKPAAFVSTFSADTPSVSTATNPRNSGTDPDTISSMSSAPRPVMSRGASEDPLLPRFQSFFDASSAEYSRSATPVPMYSQFIRPTSAFIPTREVPAPPSRLSDNVRKSDMSGLSLQNSNSIKSRPRISKPVSGTFVHANGAFVDESARGQRTLGVNPTGTGEGGWEHEEEGEWQGGSYHAS